MCVCVCVCVCKLVRFMRVFNFTLLGLNGILIKKKKNTMLTLALPMKNKMNERSHGNAVC